MNRLLINGTHSEELRLAILDGYRLENIYIEQLGQQKKGNIYKGVVTRVEPSLQAAFVDFGAERQGFLPLKEISEFYFTQAVDNPRQVSIGDVIKEGQELIVQVEKVERGNKGAALTTLVKIAGSYLVLMVNSSRAGGISRQIDGEERDSLKEILDRLDLPEGMGIIIRTAGVGKSYEELAWDLDILLRLWQSIQQVSQQVQAPALIHQESDFVVRALRDFLQVDTNEIILDVPELYQRAKEHLEKIRPELVERLKLYEGPMPLFDQYKVEEQVETAFQSSVRLPSGGAIVIQPTEALVSIDVNSAKDTKGGHIEQTALNTNREAAIEIARQLRLRDLGGLVVIDFIDMVSQDSQKEVVQVFQQAIKSDRARVQFGRISKFGLMEVSRQRLRPSLAEANQGMCPRCNGQGTIRQVESLALSIIRQMRQESLNTGVREIIAYVPVDVATLLVNEKRAMITDLEHKQRVRIIIIPHRYLETPHYKIEKIYKSSARGQEENKSSYMHQYELGGEVQGLKDIGTHRATEAEIPLIEHTLPEAPKPEGRKKQGWLKRLLNKLSGSASSVPAKQTASAPKQTRSHSEDRRVHSGNRNRNRNNNNNSDNNNQQSRRRYHKHGRNKPRASTGANAGGNSGGQRTTASATVRED
ncbi:MAG: Rne/Rng family ribonuclease [Gammaproteobacteria bacterium]|nr:Rne/Rng family ribonuclease [Gammaproteobacteria bacterium]